MTDLGATTSRDLPGALPSGLPLQPAILYSGKTHTGGLYIYPLIPRSLQSHPYSFWGASTNSANIHRALSRRGFYSSITPRSSVNPTLDHDDLDRQSNYVTAVWNPNV